jgi:protein-S-isoprenylcysteine O-methyltransferase Ste14
MELFPALQLGLVNGWLLIAFLYLVYGILLVVFPRPVVARLYDRSGQDARRAVLRPIAGLWMLVWLVLAALSPLRLGHVVFALGFALYAFGLTGFVVALLNYASTPIDRPVTTGLYRISRHPQQFMISMAFLGTSIAIGSWIAFLLIGIGIIGAHYKILAEEKACLEMYGESYRDYMERVPRYFLVF